MKMRTLLVFSLLLTSGCLCRSQKNGVDGVNLLQTEEDVTETQRPGSDTEKGEEDNHSDIWVELNRLTNMVVEQKVELRYLLARVTAAESLVEVLQRENADMEVRMTAAESLVEELQMESDDQTKELAVTQQTLRALQQRLTRSEGRVEELEIQQEGHKVTVQELQNINLASQVAFSASLLASGEGNTSNDDDFVTLVYRNIIANIGNHYNLNTGYFTAPVGGVYYFRLTGHAAHTVHSTRMRIVKNGHPMVFAGDRATTVSADAEDGISNGVVLQLEVGDVVAVQLFGEVWDDQYHRTTFSGFLLFPM